MKFGQSAVRVIEARRAKRNAKKSAKTFSKSAGAPATLSLKGGGHVGIGAGPDITRNAGIGAAPKAIKSPVPNRSVSAAPRSAPPSTSAGATTSKKMSSAYAMKAGHGGAAGKRPSSGYGAEAAKVVGAGLLAGAAASTYTPSKRAPRVKGAAKRQKIQSKAPKPVAPKTVSIPKSKGGKIASPKPAVLKPVAAPKPPVAGKGGKIGTSEPARMGSRESYLKKSSGVTSPISKKGTGGSPAVRAAEKNLNSSKGAQGSGGKIKTPTPAPKVAPAPVKSAQIETPSPKTAPAPKAPSATTTLSKNAAASSTAAKSIVGKGGKIGVAAAAAKATPPKAASPVVSASNDLRAQLAKAHAENVKLGGGGSKIGAGTIKVPTNDLDTQIKRDSISPKSNRPALRKGAGAAKRAASAAANTKPSGSGGTIIKPKAPSAPSKASGVVKTPEVSKKTFTKAKTTKIRPTTTSPAPKPTTTKLVKPKPSSAGGGAQSNIINRAQGAEAKARTKLVEEHIRKKGITVEDPKTGQPKKIAGSTAQKKIAAARRAGRPGLGTRAIVGRFTPGTGLESILAEDSPTLPSGGGRIGTPPSGASVTAKAIAKSVGRAAKGSGVAAKALAPLAVYQGAKSLQAELAKQAKMRKETKKYGAHIVGGGRT